MSDKSDAADFSRLPQFPAESKDLPDPDGGRGAKRRWVWVGLILGALAGFTVAVPEANELLRLPGYPFAYVAAIVRAPGWVISAVCPAVGWGILGAAAGWCCDSYAEDRAARNRRFDR